ncbi:unnamed protein product [Rotaria sp. Silwood2]|nr:unnamed protein product [Rotaria sp. Silwood2]
MHDDPPTQENTPVLPIPISMRFNILLAVHVPSFICYVVVIVYIFTHKTLRSAPNNYTLLFLLILQFFGNAIDIPLLLNFFKQGRVLFENAVFCYIWIFLDHSIWSICTMLVAWASFERHILIFHDRLLRKKWKNICLHYAPPFIIIIYYICYFLYTNIFYPCEHSFDFQSPLCGHPCYVFDKILMWWEMLVHFILMSVCITIFSVSLLIRVFASKRRLQQSLSWRKHSRMAFQLISISYLCLVTLLPFSIVNILFFAGFPGLPLEAIDYCIFITYFNSMCLPFVYLTSIPEIWILCKRAIRRATPRQMAPMTLAN